MVLKKPTEPAAVPANTEITIPDYSGFEVPEQDDIFERISVMALAQRESELEIERIKAALEKETQNYNRISMEELPKLMEEAQQDELVTKHKLRVKIKETLRCGLPKDPVEREKALDWLEEHGQGGSIKRAFHIFFGKEDTAWANKFRADLDKRKKKLDVSQEKTVHHGTLTKVLIELLDLEKKTNVPMEKMVPKTLFGVFPQRFTKVEPVTDKK